MVKRALRHSFPVLLLIAALPWLAGSGSAQSRPAPGSAAGRLDLPATAPATSPTQPATAPATAPQTDPRELMGFYNLMLQYRRATPIGRGIRAAHVEGEPGLYTPRISSPKYDGIRIRAMSGPSRELAHTSITAGLIYGRGGLAPGIRDVQFWASHHWLLAYLHAGLPLPPVQDDRRLFNHSWIGPNSLAASDILRRLDYLADVADKIFVVGVNNGAGSAVPALLASAYNVISVGQYDGASSGGYTTVEGPGRCKPDLVAPGALTSYATPAVTAAVAGLLEAADKMQSPDAGRAEVIRAVLLAGAQKPPQWQPQPGKPLDQHFGAGRLRVDFSHRILRAGPVTRDGKSTADGWVFAALEPDTSFQQAIEVPRGAAELSVVLTWNRRVDGRLVCDLVTGRSRWNDEARLADFDLEVRASARDAVVGESSSAIDNVEHVYLKAPSPGAYQLRVLRRRDQWPEPWDFALAWRAQAPAPPSPATQP